MIGQMRTRSASGWYHYRSGNWGEGGWKDGDDVPAEGSIEVEEEEGWSMNLPSGRLAHGA
jgi:hypothetical protein